MNVILGHDATVAKWAGERLGVTFHAPFVAIGFTRDDETLNGAAIFNGWNGSNIDVTIYGPGCMTRQSVRVVFNYVFCQLKANRMTARTARANKRMQRLLPRLGFTWEGVAKRYYGPDRRQDAIVYGLFSDTANRWL